ncbi:hypothetical protein [Sphaerisporangium krabiense]|uniref:Uncharacterized protein n=1 Tax=Sphaerisporangium krabiense TaxID=763782 RepID=A0A7W8Z808_9ACTN|nr:hypothetical protein [Sphaerisporangium krabiense]MBB5628783.1 hypothetical protein [Sphaerisporangium krabiense]
MTGDVPILRARTLVEAYLYINLTVAADDVDPADDEAAEGTAGGEVTEDAEATRRRAARRVIDYERWTTLTEGRAAWTLLFDGPDTGPRHKIILVVPYETEFAARRGELRFGPGRSEIIDPGQWQLVGAGYARRAMRDDLLYAENPGDRQRFHEVILNWTHARDAVAEAAKFLPEDGDEIPETAFWSEEGAATRRDEPERFTREGLESDIALYQRNLDHFLSLHGPHTP